MHAHHALVPNADRSAILLVGGRLPTVRVDDRRLPAVLEALEREHGIRAPFLRVAGRTEADEHATTLLEFDAGSIPPGDWVALDTVDPAAIEPGFADRVEQWLDELRGAPIPAERPPWARPGWLATASTWVAAHAPVLGEPEVLRQWPLSAVYRFETPDGVLVLKAVFSLFRHEPAVTAALARSHCGEVPHVVATDSESGWMLMRERPGSGARGEQARDGLRVVIGIQQAWAGRSAELAELGCRRRPTNDLRVETPDLSHLCDRLDDVGVAESIVHGDFHHGNIRVDGTRVAVIDWSDAAIAHPFLDLSVLLFIGDAAREGLLQTFAESWSCTREITLTAEALGCVYQAISYRAINAAFEPGDRWLFANAHDEWLERARRLAKAL